MNLLPRKKFITSVKYWWIHIFVGLTFIGFGLETHQTPEASFFTLYLLFAIVLIAEGAAQLYYAISNSKLLAGWGWYLSNGAFDLIVGSILISRSIISAELLPYFVGLWLVFKGINGVSFSIDLKEHGLKVWWWMLAFFITTAILGIFVVINPVVGIASLVSLTAYAFILLGLVMVGSALHIRQLHKLPERILSKLAKV
jgi:Uncharacterized conserved protein